MALFFSRVMSRPSKQISPSVISCRHKMDLASVVFPQPLSPTRPTVSPARKEKVTSSKAFTSATFFRSTPLYTG